VDENNMVGLEPGGGIGSFKNQNSTAGFLNSSQWNLGCVLCWVLTTSKATNKVCWLLLSLSLSQECLISRGLWIIHTSI